MTENPGGSRNNPQNYSNNRPSRVKIIPAKIRPGRTSLNPDGNKKRVAAYCRISTNDPSQAGSYELQVAHYRDFIINNPAWKLVKIYADEGISGTSTKNRVQFQEMIQDCVDGKIDYIITKSISRFARNTLDCLRYIRELKNLRSPVGVFFEKENIDTLDTKSELFLTILSSMAQEESRSISENTKWGVQKRFSRGEIHAPCKYFLGYDKDENGNLVINEEEAKIIRRIYKEFLAGKGTPSIAKGLMKDGILTARGNKKWTGDAVYKILTNERHAGHATSQKTVTVDFLTHRRVRNKNHQPQYFIKDHHPAIIPDEEWQAVQLELKRRHKMLHDPDNKYNQTYSNKSYFSNKLYCGECGSPVVRRRLTSKKNGEKYLFSAWQCRTRIGLKKDTNNDCRARYIWESALENCFMELLYDMKADREQVIAESKNAIAEVDLSEVENARLLELQQQIENINGRLHEMAYSASSSNDGVYDATVRHLAYEQEILQSELDALNEKKQESLYIEKQLEILLKYLDDLEKPSANTKFRDDIFLQTVRRGILYTDHEVIFEFNCAISRTAQAKKKK